MRVTSLQALIIDDLARRCDAAQTYRVRAWYQKTTSADRDQSAEYTIEARNKGDAETIAKQRLSRQFNIPWRMSHMIMVKFL